MHVCGEYKTGPTSIMHAHRLLGGDQYTVAWVADGWEWFVCKETVWNFAVGCVVGLHGKMVLMLQDRFVRKGPCCNLAACVRVQLSLKNREWREEQTPKLAVEENGGRTKDHTWCTADFTIPCSHQQTPLFPCWTSSSSVNETRVLTYGFLSLSLSPKESWPDCSLPYSSIWFERNGGFRRTVLEGLLSSLFNLPLIKQVYVDLKQTYLATFRRK